MALIEVKTLKTYFHTKLGVVRAVDGIDFTIYPQKTLGIVGESGCGKSVTALTIMRLVDCPPGNIVAGEILLKRKSEVIDLAKLDPLGKIMRSIRGKEIAMIFQEPMTSLNPVYTIGDQIVEAIRVHEKLKKREARNKAIEMLKAVKLPSPEQQINKYPHQLSGGMRQRAMIAMAMSCSPSLLIADEPTTALDVTIQAQMLELIEKLKVEFKAAILFITHDLGVIADIADNVAVMYLGKIVEIGTVSDIFYRPKHPYTIGLMNCIPTLITKKETRLIPIEGTIPDLHELPKGCSFSSRCKEANKTCLEEIPTLQEVSPGHKVACWNTTK